jgi:hypothetical protein
LNKPGVALEARVAGAVEPFADCFGLRLSWAGMVAAWSWWVTLKQAAARWCEAWSMALDGACGRCGVAVARYGWAHEHGCARSAGVGVCEVAVMARGGWLVHAEGVRGGGASAIRSAIRVCPLVWKSSSTNRTFRSSFGLFDGIIPRLPIVLGSLPPGPLIPPTCDESAHTSFPRHEAPSLAPHHRLIHPPLSYPNRLNLNQSDFSKV